MSTRLMKALFPMFAALVMNSQAATAQPTSAAEALNEEGKRLFKEQRYLEAYKRFKQAVSLSPEGRFYFNVCFSLNYLERFEEAIDACEQVEPSGADAKLLEKTAAVLEALRAKFPAPSESDPNAGDPDSVDPGRDPNLADPANTNAAVTTSSTEPGVDPFAVKTGSGGYQWSLGGTLAPAANLGLGTGNDKTGFYSGAGARLNLFANFMYREAQRIGLQGYFGITTLPPDDAIFDPLTIIDFGGAAFKHFGITDSIDVTSLAGIHVSLMQPEPALDEALLSLGLRLQASVDWALGAAKEHVISFSPTLNLYSQAADGNALEAADYGLDRGGASLEIALGYQYRFTTPFGSGPLFTLE